MLAVIKDRAKALLCNVLLGLGAIVGTIVMLIVMLNLMDINGERGFYDSQGHWHYSGTRWCQNPPTHSEWYARLLLSYWFTCDSTFIPRLRQHP
jgi:hypothetical protein